MIICNFRIRKIKEARTVVPLQEKTKGKLAHFLLLPHVLLGCLILTLFNFLSFPWFNCFVLFNASLSFVYLINIVDVYIHIFIISGPWDRPSSSLMWAIAWSAC